MDAIERIMGRVVIDDDGHWMWPGAKNDQGYGQIRVAGKALYVHRVTYEHTHGAIAPGCFIDHLCRVRACVNPEHLESVTPTENIRRGLRGRMVTECPQGHAYTDANTYVRPNGTRTCRACWARWRKPKVRRAHVAA